jgi:hypothetical protein
MDTDCQQLLNLNSHSIDRARAASYIGVRSEGSLV